MKWISSFFQLKSNNNNNYYNYNHNNVVAIILLTILLLHYNIINVSADTDEYGVEYEITGDGQSQPTNEQELETNIEVLMQEERDALIGLFLHTDGNSWSTSEKWLDQNEHHCMWFGVTCNQVGRVISVSLAANRLNGTIPEILFENLHIIQQLDLSLNYLKEIVPTTISKLTHMEQLDLSYNYLTINLENFNTMKQLTYLNVRWNTLITGNLESIDQLELLQVLNLQDNDMSSLTLSGIGNLKSLHTLELSKSGLKGEIPDVFDEAKSLRRFVATNNRIEGVLPKSLLNLNDMEYLDLSNNMLHGKILNVQSKSVKHFDLSNNNFTSISKDLRFSKFTQLKLLDLSGNQIGGNIPNDLYRCEELEVYKCHNCDLKGFLPFPEDSFMHLKELVLHNNKLSGNLPIKAISKMHRLERLEIDNNRFHGHLPEPLPSTIQHLNLANHYFSGEIPSSYEELIDLKVGRFEHNELTGSLPSIFKNMQELELFSVHDNLLSQLNPGFSSGKNTWPVGIDGGRSKRGDGVIVLYNNEFDEDAMKALTLHDHRTYKTCGTMNDFFIAVLRDAGWMNTQSDYYHAAYGKCTGKEARKLLSIQRMSRFPDVDELSDKGLLTQNIAAMRTHFPKEYEFYPPSFNVPYQMKEFQEAFDKSANKMWLVKPRNRCCGEGIRLINSTEIVRDLIDPELGEWYVQQFVSPPAFIHAPNRSKYKFVFRLFALVTSFAPLKVYLHREGLIFYTHTPYSVDDQTAKRSYITDYFFTDAQTTMYEFVLQYFQHLKDENVFDPDVIWDRIKSLIIKSLLAANKRTSRMQREQTIPNTIYEIYGYDIVLDENYFPYLCEINETPNMGLEVNYHPDYHGLGAEMEDLDAVYKKKLMKDTLAIADVEPRYSLKDRSNLIMYIEKQARESLCKNDQDYMLLDYDVKHACLTRKDVAIIARYEGELQVRETLTEMDMVFPCKSCDEYLYLINFQEESRENYLLIWWAKIRVSLISDNYHKTINGWKKFLNELKY